MNEMGDIGPKGLIALVQGDGRPQALRLHAHPQFADVLGRQLALAARLVQLALEGVESDLAHHRIDHILDLGRQQGAALLGARIRQQGAESQHLAKDAGGLRQGQGGRRHQRAIVGGEHLMHPMAQLMGERHHVARLALIVQQHVGMG